MYRVRILPGIHPKPLLYLLTVLKELSRQGLVDAALCQGQADLTILPRGAVPAPDCGGLLLSAGGSFPGGISCGLSSADTLSLSSIREHSALLTLRRSLFRLDGRLLEMQEIPVTFRRVMEPEPEALLLAASACLLLGGGDAQGIRLP